VCENFDQIDSQAHPGVYPGAGPRQLMELEMHALRSNPDCSVLWMAAAGSNLSVARGAFLEVAGFHPDLTINEHRELALKLCDAGLRMAPVSARSYHLTHRKGWRDPLADADWERVFYDAHPIPEVPLMSVFWASLSEAAPFPDAARIHSLQELETAAGRCCGITGVEKVREAHIAHATATVDRDT